MSDRTKPRLGKSEVALTGMYCRRCSYPLTGLSEPRCPECGTIFDPARPRTFRTRLRIGPGRLLARAVGILLLIVAAALVPKGARYYREWQQRRYAEACEEVVAAGGYVSAADPVEAPDTPEKLSDVGLGNDGLPPLDAATVARLKVYLARFPRFRLDVGDRRLEPGTFAEFSGLRNVQALSASGLRDADLPYLVKLPGLEWVALAGRQITDQGITAMRLPPNVQCLVLVRTSVSPNAIAAVEASSQKPTVFVPSIDLQSNRNEPSFKAVEDSPNAGAPGATFESWVARVDANGKIIWAGRHYPGEYTASPVWDEQRVYQPHRDGIAAYNAASGNPAWYSPGFTGLSFRLGGDLLLSVGPRGTDPETQRPILAKMAARSASTGKLLFEFTLPASDDWAINFGVDNQPAPIKAGDLILCGVWSGSKREGVTLALDHTGHERFRVDSPVVAAVTEGDGWVFLMPGDMRRIRSDGAVTWKTSSAWTGLSGQLLRTPDGDLTGLTYNSAGPCYQVARVNAATGAVSWKYTSPSHEGNHFIYSLEARMELRRNLLAITQDGTDGMYITVLDVRTGQAMLVTGAAPEDPVPEGAH